MTARRPLALLLLLALFGFAVLPAAALAQSAGDDQYQDPLGGGDGGDDGTPSTPTTPPSDGGGTGNATATPTPSAAAAPSTASQGGSTSNRSVPLARTGFDALVPGIAGVLLLAGGVALLRGPRREARRL